MKIVEVYEGHPKFNGLNGAFTSFKDPLDDVLPEPATNVVNGGGGGGGGRGRVEQSKKIECFLHNFHLKLTKKCVSNVISHHLSSD